MRRLLASLMVLLFLGTGLIVWRDPASISNLPALGLSKVDSFAAWAGMGVTQISLDGHRYASDIDIFDVLYGLPGRSLLGIDLKLARSRLEKLTWVESAEVTREYPDEIHVHIIERVPFAVWKENGKFWLIDKTGLKLAPASGQSFKELPNVAGKGANHEIARFFELLNTFAQLSREISSIKRVGGRRWTLNFKSGLVALLPARSERKALVKLDMLQRQKNILAWGPVWIDLRLADRLTLSKGGEHRVGTLSASDLSIAGDYLAAPGPVDPAMTAKRSGG